MKIKNKILDTTKGIKFIRIRDITKRLKFTKKLIWVKALGWLLSIGLMYWIFFVKLPSQISISEVMATLSAMSSLENILLLLGGLLTIVVYGWTSATVLPGLSVSKGTQSAVVGQMTSVALPVPLDMAIRFSMYKTYGFGIDESGIAVGIAGLARYFTVVAMPILGLLAVILAGDATATTFTWFLLLGVIFVVALLVIRAILRSKKSARHVGDIIEKIVNRLRKRFKHKPLNNVSDHVVNFGVRTSDVAVKHFKSIALSNIAWGFSCYLVFLMAVRFCGIGADVFSASFLLLVTGSMLLLNSIPITPGGIGVTEAVLLSVISFPNPEVQTTFTAALFVYRIYTWLLPLPVGVVAYLTWRIQVRRSHKYALAK